VTRTGRTLGLVSLVLLALGVGTRYPEFLAMGAAGLIALGSARLMVAIRAELTLSHHIRPVRLVEGEAGTATLIVTNGGRRRSLPLIATERFDGRELAVTVPSLAPGASYEAAFVLNTRHRGLYAVGPVTVVRTDPLRLAAVSHAHAMTMSLWVHPRTHRLDTVPIGRSLAFDGPTFESSPRGGVTFHSLRPYETGNDHRLVHWKSSARMGTLMVRNNVVPSEPSLTLVLDTNAASYPTGTFDEAVRIAASLSVSALDAGIPTLLLTTGGPAASGVRSGRDRRTLLDLLAAVGTSSADPGLAGLARSRPQQAGSSLVVVTGRAEPESARVVAFVRHRYETVTFVQVGDQRRQIGGIPGARMYTAATSDEFALAWNKRAAQ
jgi:uncharacterized protein (DUF58 family)